ncbi:MAG TPA: hypothetical protein VKL40_15175 [Candidatus Angelobacter sp.]|nr:hypothetical protein [Candidatus Angelobacter sp.]
MDDSRHQPPEPPDDDAASLRRPISIRRIRLREGELDQRARQAGTAVGTMVALLRDAQRKLNEGDLWKSTNPLSDLRTTAQGRAQELRHTAALRAQAWRQAALERASELHRQARTGYQQALGRNQTPGRGPMLVAAGALGFLLGAAFKAWRSSRSK